MPALVADIGGTNGRIALAEQGQGVGEPVNLKCADFESLEQLLAEAMRRLGAQPKHAAIAIAGPVAGDAIQLTNLDWSFSTDAMRQALGMNRLIVINDFTAVAWALPRLGAAQCTPIGATPDVENGLAKAVIGAGTGLGMSGLIPGPGGWAAISGEGGHVAFSPTDDRQIAVLQRLRARFGRVSLERVLSGPGLLNLYTALAEIDGVTPTLETPEAVTAADALDPAGAAQAMFATLLGTAAGDLALTLGAFGGVYVAGGIVAAMGDRFDTAAFRAAFSDKGRFQNALAETPTFLIIGPNPALIGLGALIESAGRSI